MRRFASAVKHMPASRRQHEDVILKMTGMRTEGHKSLKQTSFGLFTGDWGWNLGDIRTEVGRDMEERSDDLNQSDR